MLISDHEVELPVVESKQLFEEDPTSKNLVSHQFFNDLSLRKLLEGTIDERYTHKDANQHDFSIAETILGNIAVQIEDASFELLLLDSFSGCLDSNFNLFVVLAESLLKLSLVGVDKLFVEMVAVNVDGLLGIDRSSHEDQAVLEGH